MYILYGGPFTRALVTEMVMAEGDIDYELRVVDILAGEHRQPDFLRINPAGWVPALVTPQGETLYETPAINLYLAERHGLTHVAPGVNEACRAAFLCGLFYITGELEPVMKRYFYPHRHAVRPQDAAVVRDRALDAALQRLGVIDQHLRDAGPFHLGERFSLVDLTLSYWIASFETPDVVAHHAAVARCAELVAQRPKLGAHFETLKEMRNALPPSGNTIA